MKGGLGGRVANGVRNPSVNRSNDRIAHTTALRFLLT
jgi:hypothetical protein